MTPRRLVTACALAVAMSISAAARAEEPPPDAPMQWYGWQILLADGTSALFGVTGAAMGQLGVALFGVATYVVAPPVVHVANGQGGRAAISVIGRILIPLAVGAAVGSSAPCNKPCFGPPEEAVWGALGGMIAAGLLDAGAVAWKPGEKTAEPVGVSIAPRVDPVHRTYALSIVGIPWY